MNIESRLQIFLGGKAKPILAYSLAVIPSVLITSVIAGYWGLFSAWGWEGRVFPWWTDGGNWLKHANAILGVFLRDQGRLEPMWQEAPFQYPPLFFAMLATTMYLLGDPILSIKSAALICLFIFPLAMFDLSKKVFRNHFAGVVAAWLSAFYPLFLEFVGWGGYPNILGFASLAAAFHCILRYVEERSLEHGGVASVSIVIVVLTHHLTSLVLLGTLMLWTVFSVGYRGSERREVAVLLLTALSTSIAYRLLFAWPFDFVFYNEAAYYRLRAWVDLSWVFKSPVLSVVFSIALLVSIPSLVDRMRAEGIKSRFLGAWLLTPLIGTQGYMLRITLDYNRIFFFFFQPLMIMVSACASSINTKEIANPSWRNAQSPLAFVKSLKAKQFVQMISLSIAVLLVASNTVQGLDTVRNINHWYDSQDFYGDDESGKYGAVDWLRNHSRIEDVVIAEEPIGRWIEGVSQRKVLLYTPPQFLFMKGELEREYAARALLTSQYGIRSDDVWIFEQAPYGYLSPIVAFYRQGDYINTVFLLANSSYVSLNVKCELEKAYFTDFESEVSLTEDPPSLLIRREMESVKINETMTLNPNQTLTIRFNIWPKTDHVEITKTTLVFSFGELASFSERAWVLSRSPSTSAPRIMHIQMSVGEIIFNSDCDYEIDYDFPLTKSEHLRLIFDNQTSFRLNIRLKEIQSESSKTETYAWDEMVDQWVCGDGSMEHGALYIVLPKMPLKGQWSGSANSWFSTYLEYSHLLVQASSGGNLEIQEHANEKAIILRYSDEPD